MLKQILSFISLLAFWVIMSGYLDVIHITMGVVSVLIVMGLNHQIKNVQFTDDDLDDYTKIRFGRFIYYVIWLIIQIIKSGFTVAFVILKPKLDVQPSVVRFRTDLPNAHARVILGNSITLTPGTLTVDIEGDKFTVHSLIPASYEGIVNDEMPKMVLSLFTKEDRPVISDVNIITKSSELA